MCHAIRLPKPLWGYNVRAHDLDGSKPDTCARRPETQLRRRRANLSNRRAGRASSVSRPARGGGKEDAEREQRAGCCAGHPLNFQLTLATPHRHACQFGGNTPVAHTHTRAHPNPRASSTKFRLGEWCTPPPLSSSKRLPTIGKGNVAASPGHAYWEAIEWVLHHFPNTPDPRFAHGEVSSPQKGYHKHDRSMAVDWGAISGRASPIIDRDLAAPSLPPPPPPPPPSSSSSSSRPGTPQQHSG
jgi:hypothetical protein